MVPYGSHKDLDGAWRHDIVIKETRDGREQKLYGKYRDLLKAIEESNQSFEFEFSMCDTEYSFWNSAE